MWHIQLQARPAKQSLCVITSEKFAPFYIPPGHVTAVYGPKKHDINCATTGGDKRIEYYNNSIAMGSNSIYA